MTEPMARATPEQWATVRHWANLKSSADSCILELLDRIVSLESKPIPSEPKLINDIPSETELSKDMGLLDAVSQAIDHSDPKSSARAVVRAVALWVSEASLEVYSEDRAVIVNSLLDQANHES